MADIDRLASDGLANFASPAIDTVKFCQLLAKIAHSFAVAEIGLGNFQPLLADFAVRSFPLREQYTDCYHLVGGDPKSYAPSEALHTLGWGVWQNGLEAYLIVCIRLFASLGAPSYVLVAGKLTCEAHHEAVRARAEALARRPDKTPA
ncbi:hypothetical protein [Constrictibacter sp. MBR-5]|jgi:hypothetical protein|uniref:hypothetical protein n=1 Tax=Constrictibacter sp. MBR-5 TaxID=3156467 RepID=UPI003397FF2C